jgi:hypothetical protein
MAFFDRLFTLLTLLATLFTLYLEEPLEAMLFLDN